MKFFELYVCGLFSWIINYYIGRDFFEIKKNNHPIRVAFAIVILSLLLVTVNYLFIEVLHGVLKIVLSYIMLCIFYKIIFKRDMSTTLVASLILYLIFFVSEIILASIFSAILTIINQDSLAFLQNTATINVLNTLVSYFIAKIGSAKFIGLIKNSKFNSKGSIFIVLLLLVTITLLFFRIPVSRWSFNAEFLITMIILFGSCLISLLLVKQKADIHKTTSMYQQLVEYSDITNGLLEDYRIVSHEHKNQLSIIRGMIDNSNQELVEYIDNLLEKRDIIKYQWIGELNHLPLSGLKGLINYKLIEMEKAKIITNISISKEVTKTKLEKLSTKQKDNLYSIMGVYLDNAIQAAKNSKEKEVSLEIYKEKKEIVIVLANTYKGQIELDKIDNYGYTTKGKNHGIGLHLAKKILEGDNTFSQNRSLFENYYIQELRIHLSQI